MTWKVTIEGRSCSFDDLAPEVFEKVATEHGVSWLGLDDGPGETPGTLYDLIAACAEQMGVDPPARPVTMGELKKLTAMMETIESDLPTTWDEGGLPLAEDNQETESSSGS